MTSVQPSTGTVSPDSGPHLAWLGEWSLVPSSPGVYWFLDANGVVLYVGKAKNLKNRLTSYKQWRQTSGKTRKLVFAAQTLRFQVLQSELEALLVEAELIRTHQPEYNILLKDDKSPLYVHITDDEFPRVLTVRKKEIDHQHLRGTILGPFPSGYQLKEVLKIARHIFPWCNQERQPCFYSHIDLCPGVCTNSISAPEYQASIHLLIRFLRGQQRDVVKNLEHAMQQAAEQEAFERAATLRDTVSLIKKVTQPAFRLSPNLQLHLPKLAQTHKEEQVIQLRRILTTYLALPKTYPLTTIEAYDVSNIQGTNASVALVSFTDGVANPKNYRSFTIKTLNTPNDFAMLQEALLRRQNHPEWGTPNLLVIDGGKGQLRSVLKVWQWPVPVISLAKKPDRIIVPQLQKNSATAGEKSQKLSYKEIALPADHPALRLLQQLRNEAHRFSKKHHTMLRTRSMLE